MVSVNVDTFRKRAVLVLYLLLLSELFRRRLLEPPAAAAFHPPAAAASGSPAQHGDYHTLMNHCRARLYLGFVKSLELLLFGLFSGGSLHSSSEFGLQLFIFSLFSSMEETFLDA